MSIGTALKNTSPHWAVEDWSYDIPKFSQVRPKMGRAEERGGMIIAWCEPIVDFATQESLLLSVEIWPTSNWPTTQDHAELYVRHIRCVVFWSERGEYKAIRDCWLNFRQIDLLGSASGVATHGETYKRSRTLLCFSSQRVSRILGYASRPWTYCGENDLPGGK